MLKSFIGLQPGLYSILGTETIYRTRSMNFEEAR